MIKSKSNLSKKSLEINQSQIFVSNIFQYFIEYFWIDI